MYKNYEDILSVKLVSYTTPSRENLPMLFEPGLPSKTISNLLAYCARVSNPNNQENIETTNKLLKYLIDNKHWSPFDMASICLEVVTTRDIARQILRHASMKFQEFSQRYSNPLEELELCIKECRLQDTKNRQNSFQTVDEDLKEWWRLTQIEMLDDVKMKYKMAINKGIAKEVARCILPEGNTVSRMYINGTIRSWIHYIDVRDGNGTQKEHMMVARASAEAINKLFPYIK
jgi:thymidylate synthase (FAD)